MKFSKVRPLFFTGSNDGIVKMWDFEGNELCTVNMSGYPRAEMTEFLKRELEYADPKLRRAPKKLTFMNQ